MPHEMMTLARESGLSLATHVWTTTVASHALIAAPGSGRALRLHYISIHQSTAAGLSRIVAGTTAATNYWNYTASGPHTELALITLGENEPASLFAAATVGNGNIRVYYSVVPLNGS